jgi:hypothetical protein
VARIALPGSTKMMTPRMMGAPFGSEPPVPTPPRGPRSRRWRIIMLGIGIAVALTLVLGGTALAHSMQHMVGGCGGG